MLQLILARDGENTADSDERYLGYADVALTERGQMQAEKLAQYLRRENIDAVYCSTCRSAKETADIITDKLGLNFFPLNELRERRMGLLDGLLKSEALKIYPEIVKKLQTLPKTFDILEMNGERYLDFKERVKSFLKLILKRHDGKSVLAITHESVIRMVLLILTGPADEDQKLTFGVGETGITRIFFSSREVIIKCVNCQSHLEGIDELLRKKDEIERLLKNGRKS